LCWDFFATLPRLLCISNSKHGNTIVRSARDLIDNVLGFVEDAPTGNRNEDFMAFEVDHGALLIYSRGERAQPISIPRAWT
jgi:hypothetical protein